MIPTPELLSAHETCPRKAYLSRSWALRRLAPMEMVRKALDVALRASGQQEWGEIAGSEIMGLAEDRGIELPERTSGTHIYASVIHHACLSDLLVSAIRKPKDEPWRLPESLPNWESGCYLSPDGRYLRRIVFASHWNDDRHYSECRAWYSLGEVAHYNLPLQMVVFVVGPMIDGLRRSPWTQGFLHPSGNGVLRFRKKYRGTLEEFKPSWTKIRREDHAEISRETWLEAMLADGLLPEVCFNVEIPVLAENHRKRILEMAKKKADRIDGTKEIPEVQLTGCDFPIPCIFNRFCHSLPERTPSEKDGFIRQIQPLCDAPVSQR